MTFDVSARTLVAHEESGFRERGITAALSFPCQRIDAANPQHTGNFARGAAGLKAGRPHLSLWPQNWRRDAVSGRPSRRRP